MSFRNRLLITLVAMLAASYIFGLIWTRIFNTIVPSYLAGVAGGLAALPVWELLKGGGPKA
ncbi:MAG: hypothetical protein QME75_04200 [Deltaproteobacteria bacterium]|nr:hypothetical protein [Deltaproteobacteria bacterium]